MVASCRLAFRQGRRATATVLAALLIAAAAVIGGQSAVAKSQRPAAWAQPVASTVLRNWYEVDEGLYRSRQPNRAGFEEAKRIGIRTIIDLRSRHDDAELAEGLGFNLVDLPMHAWHFSDDQVLRALKAIQGGPRPVLVHCQQGADRTGVVMAAYRVVVQGWTKDEALAELKHGGFGFHWYYVNIPAFIKHMDAAKMRAALAGCQAGS